MNSIRPSSRYFHRIVFATLLLGSETVHADESPGASTPSIAGPSPATPALSVESSAAPASDKKRPKRKEAKETEGSVAPGRFEAETILKSQYHLNGQQLEVDPD